MNYDVKETLFDQAKQSLKKFKREVCSSSTSLQGAPSMTLKPAFLVENGEASLAAGYVRLGRQRLQSV